MNCIKTFGCKNLKRNELDISYPFITSYPHHAMIFSLLGKKEYYYPILINHYLQLVYYKNERLDFNMGFNVVEFLNNIPNIHSNKVERKILKILDINLLELIKAAIDSGFCIYMLIDLFNVEQCKTYYLKKHLYHDMMIYGYDLDKKTLLVGEFFDGKKYSFYEINVDDIICDSYSEDFFDWLGGIRMYKIKQEPYGAFVLNVDLVKEGLEKYISSSKGECVNFIDNLTRNEDYIYGIKIYDKLIEVCDEKKCSKGTFDLRTISVLLDHKKVIIYIIKELYKNNCLCDAEYHYCQAIEICNKIRILSTKLVKYNMTLNSDILGKVKEMFEYIRDLERKWIEKLILDVKLINSMSICRDNVQFIDIIDNGKSHKFSFFGDKLFIEKKKPLNMVVYIDKVFVLQSNDSNNINIDNIANGFHLVEIITEEQLINNINIITNTSEKKYDEYNYISVNNISEKNVTHEFGKAGKIVYGGHYEYPPYLGDIRYTEAYLVVLSKVSKDFRSVKVNDQDLGVEAYLLNAISFDVYIRICGDIKRKVTLYFSDYEFLGRKVSIECYRMGTDEPVEKIGVLDLKNSFYVTFDVLGDVRFKIIKEAGPDATLSAIYFD